MNKLLRSSILFLFLTAAFSSNILAQKVEFKPGVVFLNEGDSITGFVKYNFKSSTSGKVEFKESELEKVRELGPADIKGFAFENNSFVSKKVLLDSNVGAGKVFEGLQGAQPDKVLVFVQKLVGGSKELYVHTDELEITRFFINRDGETELLKYGSYSRLNSENEVVTRKDNYFKMQLESYLNACSSINDALASTYYSQKRLISLFKEYSTCVSDKEISFFNAAYRKKPQLSFLAGLTSNQIDFSDGTNNQAAPSPGVLALEFDPTIGIAFGVGLNLDATRSGKFSIATSLLYTTFNSTGESTVTTSSFTTFSNASVKYSSIRFNFLPRYNVKLGGLELFMQGGFSIGSLSVSKNEITTRSVSNSRNIERTTSLIDEDQLFASYAARVLGLGLEFGEKFTFETRLELGGSLHGVRDLASDTKRTYFLLGYIF